MVDIHKLRTTWLLLILICFVTSDYITVGPQDTVVESEQTIMLTCSANFRTGASIWWSIIGENSKDIYKYEGSGGIILPPGSGKYEVRPMDENWGIFDLYIYDVQWYDGGTYECRYIYPQQGIDDGAIADVVIVERPVITQTPLRPLDGELVTVWCSVSFGTPFNLTEEDSMLPYIAVYYQGVQLLDGEYTEVINPPNIIYSIVDVKHNLTLTWEDDSQYIQCTATVDKPHLFLSVSRPIDVFYGARNLSFEPRKDQFYVGDVITCKVYARPDPDIVWHPLHDPTLEAVYGEKLTLDVSFIGNNKWRCTANNTVEDEHYVVSGETEFTVVLQTTTTSTRAPTTEGEEGSRSPAFFPNSFTIFLISFIAFKYCQVI